MMADPYNYFEHTGPEFDFRAPSAQPGSMPTANDYYFGGGQPSYEQSVQNWMNSPIRDVYGGPTTPQGYNPPTSNRAGSINISGGTFTPPVPSGAIWNRYNAIMADPNVATADPAYQFLFNQGQEALNRTAAARRMRFAGKTMLDAQNFGQGLAAQNLRQILPELRAGAQDEYSRMAQQATAQYQLNAGKAAASDPYGQARRIASRFPTFSDYQTVWGSAANYDLWKKGKDLNATLGLG